MAGITVANEKGCLRLYCTFSFRDNDNKPQRVRKAIGKIDPNTGDTIFNSYFKNIITLQGISIDKVQNIPYHEIPNIVNLGSYTKEELINRTYINKINDLTSFYNNNITNSSIESNLNTDNSTNNGNNNNFSVNNDNNSLAIEINNGQKINIEENNYSIRKIGRKFILDSIIASTGLLNILKKIFPNSWDKIITLAYYIVSDNSAIMYCQDWVEENETILNNSSLASQRISELFFELKNEQILQFWESWASLRQEDEYLALDITSISSYSNLISEAEFGHNRDEEKIPQINLCMLFGEKSALPVFSSHYAGSLNDVTILLHFLILYHFLVIIFII
ncbi:MAG: hypothetical protein LBS60_10740 [Deltaproteobacteria bacterium]|nr:hypothetical protein [Deltaproteobacteria bacterium]